jgi:hypothetical protein
MMPGPQQSAQPAPFGSTGPATTAAPQEGKMARGRVLGGIGLEMLRMAASQFKGDSEEGIALMEAAVKLGKMFKKPPADMEESELKFMQAQLRGGGGGSPMDGGAQKSLQQAGAGQPMQQPGPSPIPIPEVPRPAA